MPSSTSAPAHHATPAIGHESEPTECTTVLDRVAARVRRRLADEQIAAHRAGDGGHAASLTLPRPL